MLYVLLVLLKIIAMILALMIGMVILILAAPIRYSFQFQVDENTSPRGQIRVTWLLFIIYVKASYIDKIFDYRIRIFGCQIWGNQKEFLEKKQKKKKKKQKKKQEKHTPVKEQQQKEGYLPKKEMDISEKEPMSPVVKPMKKEESSHRKKASSEPKKSRRAKKKGTTIKKNWITLLKEKIDDGKKAWYEYRGEQLLDFTKKSIIKILRHILPRKLQGYLRFGLDDPAWTGILTGVAAMFYPRYHKTFTLEPDFGEQCFSAHCKGKGRIRFGFFLYIAITALLNRDVRVFVKKILG